MRKLFVAGFLCCLAGRSFGDPDLRQVARDRCAFLLGVSADELEDVIANATRLHVTKESFSYFKFARPVGGDWCELALSPGGESVDAAKLIAREEAAQQTLFGSLSVEQDRYLRSIAPELRIKGVLILTRPVTPDFRRSEVPALAKKEFLASFIRDSAVIERLRSSFPRASFESFDDFFAVRFDMLASELMVASKWNDFSAVAFEDTTIELLQSAPRPVWYNSMQFGGAHTVSLGLEGRVGVVESGQLLMPLPSQLSPSTTVVVNGNNAVEKHHAERVLSVVSSADVQQPFSQTLSAPGSAPLAEIDYAANSSTNGLAFSSSIAAVQALLRRGQDVFNFSFFSGVYDPSSNAVLHTRGREGFGMYVDELAYDFGTTFVAGAGNIRSGNYLDDDYVPSPANGLNVFAVGASNSNRTNILADDRIASFSSYRNPTGLFGGRPKPDVVAPGQDVMVWDSLNNSDVINGTSYSSPQVAGVAALLNSRWRQMGGSTALPNELVRSIVAASAQQNVDKVVVHRRSGGFPIVPLSEYDGAGGVDAAGAMEILSKSWVGYMQIPNGCPPANGPSRYQVLPGAKFSLSYGERARVAMAYSSLGTRFGSPTADFDVVVAHVDSNGKILRLVAWSGFQDNTLEALEFKADFPGLFQVFYKNSTIGPCTAPFYVGYAFWPRVPSRE